MRADLKVLIGGRGRWSRQVSDSGPNLGVRGVGCLLVLMGLLLILTGHRIRDGTSRLRVPPRMVIYGSGVFTLGGVVVVLLGTILLGMSI